MGNTCNADTGFCGCKGDYDCKRGFECNASGFCVKSPCRPKTCKSDSANYYKGNVCVEDYADGELNCGCNSNADCNAGYRCNTTMKICVVETVVTNPKGICDGKSDDDRVCAGSDVVYCGKGREVFRMSCGSLDDKSYLGDACVSATDFCGCNSDSDCRFGYSCGSDHTCAVKSCSPSDCKSMTGDDYFGNTCVDGYYDSTKLCGCNSDSDCNTGYTCIDMMKTCVKKEVPPPVETNICTGKKNDSRLCDGNDLVYCRDNAVAVRESCALRTTGAYLGDACIDEYDFCGCNTNEDCKSGYECNDNICEKLSCVVSECKAMTGDNYLGNACVDGYEPGKKLCGCNSNADCKSGYECNSLMLTCQPTNGSSSSLCDGKSDDERVCNNNTLVYCYNNKVSSSYKCTEMRDAAYVGDKCISSMGYCGCESNKDCKYGYKCNAENTCIKSCDPAKCQDRMIGYAGNVCIDVIGGELDEKVCGCHTDADCKNGYLCGDQGACVPTKCDTSVCKRRTGNDYVGNACVSDYKANEWTCGCKSNSDCKDGYVCNTTVARCTAIEETEYGNICSNQKDDSTVCDGSDIVFCYDGYPSFRSACIDLVSSSYSGSACLEDVGFCGCKSNADCRDGYECKDGVCEKEQFNICKGIQNDTTCEGSDLVYCENATEISRKSCTSFTLNSGSACITNSKTSKNACGCNDDEDCFGIYKCSSKQTCISAIIDFRAPSSMNCSNIKSANSQLESCDYKGSDSYSLKFNTEAIFTLTKVTSTMGFAGYSYALSSSSSLEMSNLRKSSTLTITWEPGSNQSRYDNKLTVSDGVNSETFSVQNYGENQAKFRLSGDAKSVKLEYDGASSGHIKIRQIMIM